MKPPMRLLRGACLLALTALARSKINRKSIVDRYNVVRTAMITNSTTPLQVGNGDFAFNVDVTGLQTFLPFNTMASWAWHNDSLPTDGEKLSDYHGVNIPTHERDVYYDLPDPNLPQISQWIIGNPNKINLARIALKFPKNETLDASALSNIKQELFVYTGIIKSSFTVLGKEVVVTTQGDFESDAVAISVTSDLVASGDLEVYIDFPYPPIHSTTYKYEVFAGSYAFPSNHTTKLESSTRSGASIYHEMQETKYYTNLAWLASTLSLTRDEPEGSTNVTAHRYTLAPTKLGAVTKIIAFTAHFGFQRATAPSPALIAVRNPIAWAKYWENGGFVDLTSSSNPAADELQRRIILSMYHVRVNSAGQHPPQESGLMNNGWYGKFHMEMLIWHLAHWSTWSREEHIQRIVPAIYETFLPSSLERAQKMGWEGAKWPKMTDPQTGRSSPGAINGQLLWQEPHPMYLATLEYQAAANDAERAKTLRRWDKVISATADHIASYVWWNHTSGVYDIGPPAYGVTENTPPNSSLNLAYETAAFHYALETAIGWKNKLGQTAPARWTEALAKLAPLPTAPEDGTYVVYQGLDLSFWNNTSLTGDPRSLILVKGFLPDTRAVDFDVAKRTAQHVWDWWLDTNIRGWGRPVLAISATRLGEPERAIFHVTNYERWIFDDAGFAVRGGDGGTPPPFMPGNAGFLLAVSYMTVGWQGSTSETPGFPTDGTWTVKYENLRKAP